MGLFAAGMGILTYGMIISEAGLPTLGTRTVAAEGGVPKGLIERICTTRLALSIGVLSLSALILFFTLHSHTLRNIALIYLAALIPAAFVLEWVFQGLRRMTLLAAGRIVAAASFLVWIILFVRQEASLLLVPVGWVISVGAQSVYLWRRYNEKSEVVPASVPRPGELLKTALPLGIAGLVAQFVTQFPVIYLGVTDPREGGLFSVALRVIVLMLVVDRVFYTLFFPAITRHLKTAGEEVISHFNRVLKLITVVTLTAAVVAIMASRDILPLIFGSEFTRSALIFQILSVYFVCSVINSVFTFTLIGAGREKVYLNSLLLGGVGFFGITLLPGPLPSSHLAAMGLVLFQVISLLVMVREVQTFIPFRLGRPLLLPVTATVLLMVVFSFTWPSSPLLTFLASAALTPAILYKAAGITPEEKAYYIRSLS